VVALNRLSLRLIALLNESEKHFFNLLKKALRTVGVARSAKGSLIPKRDISSTVCFNHIVPFKTDDAIKRVFKANALCSKDDVYLTRYKWQKKRLIVEI
jgi:hypothetical protein